MKLSRRLRALTNRLGWTRPKPFTQGVVFDRDFADAIRRDDEAFVRRFIAENPKHIDARTPFAGGTWLHHAAGGETPKMIHVLVELGFDVNKPGYMEGDLALCSAAGADRLQNAKALLDLGSRIDTSKSVRNPLFAAIVGQSHQVVGLLLGRGIDAGVRYRSPTMKRMDAIAFALWRGRRQSRRRLPSTWPRMMRRRRSGCCARLERWLAGTRLCSRCGLCRRWMIWRADNNGRGPSGSQSIAPIVDSSI